MLPAYRMGPEDTLPAEETVLLLTEPSLENLQQWKSIFPVLDDVISDDPLDAIAIIRKESALQSVGFRHKSGGWDGKSCDIGPYQMVFSQSEKPQSCPTLQELDRFLAPGPRLAHDRGWKALGKFPKGSWTFARSAVLPEGMTLQERVLWHLQTGNATHLLAFKENGNHIVRSWPNAPLSPFSRESLLMTPMQNPIVLFALGNAKEIFASLEKYLSPDDRIILEGLLLQKLENLSGPNVSLRHELLPLLETDAEVHTGTTASGAHSILLTGTARNTTDVALRIDALHRSFALRHPDVELLEFAFDDGRFPFQTLRLARTASDAKTEQIRGWAVTISRDAIDGAILMTAVNGRQNAVSNDPDLLQQFLMEEGAMIPLPAAKRPIISRMGAAMVLPSTWFGNAPFWMTKVGKSVVSIEQTGEMRTVRIAELKM